AGRRPKAGSAGGTARARRRCRRSPGRAARSRSRGPWPAWSRAPRAKLRPAREEPPGSSTSAAMIAETPLAAPEPPFRILGRPAQRLGVRDPHARGLAPGGAQVLAARDVDVDGALGRRLAEEGGHLRGLAHVVGPRAALVVAEHHVRPGHVARVEPQIV